MTGVHLWLGSGYAAAAGDTLVSVTLARTVTSGASPPDRDGTRQDRVGGRRAPFIRASGRQLIDGPATAEKQLTFEDATESLGSD